MGWGTGWLADDRRKPDLSAHRAGAHRLSRPRAPARLPGLVDSHAHLQHARFDGNRDAVIERAREAGIERILVPGWDLASSEAALELATRHPDVIHAAVGVHPHDASAMDEVGWARLESLAAEAASVAIGEIGLDYHRLLSPADVQRAAFERQLALAARLVRPVLVHDREAHGDVEAALLAWEGRAGSPGRGVLHAYSGDGPMAARLSASGYLISFALPLTFRSATGPREAAGSLKDGGFLIETDAPYLGPDRERTNEPTTVLRIVAELARLRATWPDALVGPVRQAYRELIG
ncbi:MAG TPA: TatD family hydrolase [Candidatus Limnocylindria bacterium]|nr:TatD family hydrolase [Candidatus Limnocylindria bacterium]